jgi:hypothetical protein
VLFLFIIVNLSFDAYLDSSLAFIGFNKNDMTFRNDLSARDHYRFAIIDSLLLRPLDAVDFALAMDAEFWDDHRETMLESVGRLYGFQAACFGGSFFARLNTCYDVLRDVYSDIPADLDSVLKRLTVFSPEPTGSIEEEKAYEKEYDSLVNYLGAHAAGIDYEKIFNTALAMLAGVNEIGIDAFRLPAMHPGVRWQKEPSNVRGITGDVLYSGEFDFGRVVVGDSGSNTYCGNFAVIIDIGGDDVYQCASGGYLNVIIDESGNDSYLGGDCSIACGNCGVSLLVDNGGDDTYEAQSFSLGAGIFGVGILIDRAGNDRYSGDTFTQGAGGFGIGILMDREGNDTYAGALYAQGFASTYGVGILGDGQGNDTYLIEEKYVDEIRYMDHYLSMSQGFSIGFRPDLSAGIGLLLDQSGNDQYIGDIFGQGASYWYGLGAIVDGAGNDNYIAYQYAQGSGIHIAFGLLIDRAGDDNYIAKGVSQGCGHDLSLGVLYDQQGSDTYAAFDLSQGAGSANGIGLLIDELGDDNYSVKRLHNTQGYGDHRREYGSIGVLMDLAGDDIYTSGRNGEFWEKGEYGIGIDWR